MDRSIRRRPKGRSLAPEEDLWGRIMRDYHLGRPALYGFRYDSGEVSDGHSPEVYFADPDRFFDWEAELLEDLSGPVLDVGAGPGRIALHLQRQGLQVVAIESSPMTARIARERGVRDVRVGRWEALERVLRSGESGFASVLLMGHNFGLAGTLAGLERLLRALHGRARSGAALVGTSLDPLAGCARRRGRRYPGELHLCLEYGGAVGPGFPWLIVDAETLGAVALRCGWQIECLVQGDESAYGVRLRRCGQNLAWRCGGGILNGPATGTGPIRLGRRP